MPKYQVWFTVRGIGGRTGLSDIVKAKDKDAARAEIRRVWYGELPEIQSIKAYKEK